MPNETSIEILDSKLHDVWGFDQFGKPESEYNFTVWIDREQSYVFKVFDSAGNGMCCSKGNGMVKVYIGDQPDLVNDIPIICEEGAFGFLATYTLDIKKVAGSTFLSYIPTLERQLSEYLSRVIEGTWGAKDTCLFGLNPYVKVDLLATSPEGATVLCDNLGGN